MPSTFLPRDKLKPVRGRRKALVLISDGRDNASRVSVVDTIEMLQSADTILYALNPGTSATSKLMYALAPSLYVYDRLSERNHMQRMATESGGQEFKVSRANLAKVFRQMEEELRTTYVLSYISSNTTNDGKWRKIEIRPNRPGLSVRARPGYRLPAP